MPQHYDELGADQHDAALEYGVALDEDSVEELYSDAVAAVDDSFLPDDSYDDILDDGDGFEGVEEALYAVTDEVEAALADGEQDGYHDTVEMADGVEIEYDVDIDDERDYADVAVTFADLPEGLHGFTDTSTDFVVINKNLYEFERETTIEHEKEHQRNPHMPEWQIRHRVGGTDPEYSASVRHNPRDIGDGTVSQYGCC